MSTTREILSKIIFEFKEKGYSQVPGYYRFGYLKDFDSGIMISRETGKDTKIPYSKIMQGIEAVRSDASVYDGGPSRLREYGITHINSPIWSLLHLVPKSQY